MNKALLVIMVGSLAATLWLASTENSETVEPVKSSGTSAAPGRAASRTVKNDAPHSNSPSLASSMAHALSAWQKRGELAVKAPAQLQAWGAALPPPPPPKAAQFAPAPEPIAPKFPHAWVGRFNDQAVISGPHSTWVLGAGQAIEGQWRVDQISGRSMQVTYLPLKQVQTVAMQSP